MRRSTFAYLCSAIATAVLSFLPLWAESRTVSPISYVTPAPYRYYGHRSLPSSGELSRGERSHAPLYESPDTYEYMINPEKSGRSRVPKTEKLPPGDDVELIDSEHLSSDLDVENDRRAPHRDNKNKNKKKTKKKRKATSASSSTNKRDHRKQDTNRKGVEKRHKTERYRADVKQPQKNKKTEVMTKSKGGKGNASSPVFKHKILKKNEYSTKQQFFDEEHVVKKNPARAATFHGGGNRKTKDNIKNPSSNKGNRHAVVANYEKDDQNDNYYGYVNQQSKSPGYGQILAVR